MHKGPTVAREFLRVSFDKSGEERSNNEQHDDNVAHWPDFEFGRPYSEVGSASRYASRPRDDFPVLLADLTGGRFGADVLVMWEGSRGSRRVGEWVELIDLCEKHRVKIAVTEHDRVYNPANPKDRKDLIDEANDSEYESGKTSQRIKRNMAANRAKLRPHGKVLYGYRRIYHSETRKLIRQEPEPFEATVVQFVFHLFLAGWSIRSIARTLHTGGLRSRPTGKHPHGGRWTEWRVRNVLMRDTYAGRLVHEGEQDRDGNWPALIDPDAFDRAAARLEFAKERAVRYPGYGVNMLTGVARCGPCTAKLRTHPVGGVKKYYCRECGRITRDADKLDDYVTAYVLLRLSRPDAFDLFNDGDDPAVANAKVRVAELKAELEEAKRLWRGEVPGRKLTPTGYAEMEAWLLPKIAEAQRAARATVIPLDIDLPPAERLEEWWFNELSSEQRREIVAALVVAVVVHPVGRGKRNYDWSKYTEIEPRR